LGANLRFLERSIRSQKISAKHQVYVKPLSFLVKIEMKEFF
jgi:hypothetical protein